MYGIDGLRKYRLGNAPVRLSADNPQGASDCAVFRKRGTPGDSRGIASVYTVGVRANGDGGLIYRYGRRIGSCAAEAGAADAIRRSYGRRDCD